MHGWLTGPVEAVMRRSRFIGLHGELDDSDGLAQLLEPGSVKRLREYVSQLGVRGRVGHSYLSLLRLASHEMVPDTDVLCPAVGQTCW